MYCIFADVHANLEALEAVLEAARLDGAKRFACLGDTVGYGADPMACVRLVRETCEVVLAGNHDLAAIGRQDISWFNPVARDAIIWTNSQLDEDAMRYLDSLPSELLFDSMLLAHGSPLDPVREYVIDQWSAMVNFHDRDFELCFVGHTHYPIVFELNTAGEEPADATMLEPAPDSTLELAAESRYIINPGGVGQPRDGISKAAYLLYDPDNRLVRFRRVPYALETAQEKIRAAGLPEKLAERLAHGG